MTNALTGVEELKKSVDSLITIPNDKIAKVVKKGTSFKDALKVADEVLRQGIRGIAELIIKPSLINLDFADVKTTLKGRGLAHMGIGVAKGEKRIYEAVRCAVCSPLLNTTIEGANAVIINVIGGSDLGLEEVTIAANLVKDVIDYSANVIFGACIDENMADEVEIVIIATGFGNNSNVFAPNSQNEALRQASMLSRKLDYAYSNQLSDGVRPNAIPAAEQPAQQTTYTSPYEAINRAQAMQPTYVKPMEKFEPDDPIPEGSTDRKHRPHFVDFFMRKNENNDK
jgi:cell division GTPase FtsZ